MGLLFSAPPGRICGPDPRTEALEKEVCILLAAARCPSRGRARLGATYHERNPPRGQVSERNAQLARLRADIAMLEQKAADFKREVRGNVTRARRVDCARRVV